MSVVKQPKMGRRKMPTITRQPSVFVSGLPEQICERDVRAAFHNPGAIECMYFSKKKNMAIIDMNNIHAASIVVARDPCRVKLSKRRYELVLLKVGFSSVRARDFIRPPGTRAPRQRPYTAPSSRVRSEGPVSTRPRTVRPPLWDGDSCGISSWITETPRSPRPHACLSGNRPATAPTRGGDYGPRKGSVNRMSKREVAAIRIQALQRGKVGRARVHGLQSPPPNVEVPLLEARGLPAPVAVPQQPRRKSVAFMT